MGGWLAGALTASIALLPLWAGIWSRLGPSEILGAGVLGAIMLCANATLTSGSDRFRGMAAAALAILSVMIAGIKETFLPLALGGGCILIVAMAMRRISVRLGCVLSVRILASVSALTVFILRRAGASGADYYGHSIGMLPVLAYAGLGVAMGLLRSFWLWAFPLMLATTLRVISKEQLSAWFSGARTIVALYAILILMYAGQCGIYRRLFPAGSRYDFPAMLLVPFTCCLIAGALSHELRKTFSEPVVRYAQWLTALFVGFALATVNVGSPPALATAVDRNIRATRQFADVLHRASVAAAAQPTAPIILEVHGPDASEPAASMHTYLRALGVHNLIAVRLHRQQVGDALGISLQDGLQAMQDGHDSRFVGLETLPRSGSACISIGLFGQAEPSCAAFEIKKSP